MFKINLDDVEKDVSEYKSLGEFFVRNLKDGARPIEEGLVSPVDGELKDALKLSSLDEEFKIKGSTYSVSNLANLFDVNTENNICKDKDTYLYNFYLSPKDYHHIHAPDDLRITHFEHIPGALFSVGNFCQRYIPFLFAINERIAVYMHNNNYDVILIMVGAYNVGSIELTFTEYKSNSLLYTPGIKHYLNENITVKKGERIGSFNMGSSVVLFIVDKNNQVNKFSSESKNVKYGQSIF